MGTVEPVAAEVVPVSAFGLGDLVFVVGEAEVDAPAVQIDRLAREGAVHHGGALQVPAGTALAPGAGPIVVAIFGFAGLPEREITNGLAVVFIRVVERTGGVFLLGAQLALLEPGKAAVVLEGADAEVNRAVPDGVGVALFDQAFDQGNLLGDVLDCAGLQAGRAHIQGQAVGVKFVGPVGGELCQGFTPGLRLADGFVVQIGDIAHVPDPDAIDFQHAAQHVLNQKSAEIADMRRPVNCRAAAVETQRLACCGFERFDGSAEGVVELDGH